VTSSSTALRVCIVSRTTRIHGIGGLQDHTESLAAGLARAGHAVTVVTSRHPDGRTSVSEEAGIRRVYVAADGASFTAQDWRRESLQAFLAEHRRAPFDVVHSQGSSALELVRAGVGRRVPVVAMFHGNFRSIAAASLRRQRQARSLRELAREQRGLLRLARMHYALGNWRCFRECEAIVPSQAQLLATCRSHRLDPRRTHVVPNGVDTELFRPRDAAALRRELGLPEGTLFAAAGRLNRAKGVDLALEALARVLAGGCDASLLVIGEGEEAAPLARLAAELGLRDAVRFTGPLDHARLASHLAASDVFVFPTRHNEAAPLGVRQALASGLAVVASRIGAVTETVGDAALLVEPGDTRVLAEAMTQLAADPAARAALGSAARRLAVREYSLERMVARTVAVYRMALRERAPVCRAVMPT
jgi:glycosyltransferase involved in cell wall biosynthesis